MSSDTQHWSNPLTYGGSVKKLLNDHRASLRATSVSPDQPSCNAIEQPRNLGPADLYQQLSHKQQASWNKWHYERCLVENSPPWADAETIKAAEVLLEKQNQEFSTEIVSRYGDECRRLAQLNKLYKEIGNHLEWKHQHCSSERQREEGKKRLQKWKALREEGGFGEMWREGYLR